MVLVESPTSDNEPEQRKSPPPLPKPAPATERPPADAAGAVNLADTVDDPTMYGSVEPLPDQPAAPLTDVEPLADIGEAVSDSEPLLPTDAWTPQPAYPWRSWVLLGGAGCAGIVLAMACYGWLTSGGDETPPPTNMVAEESGQETETLEPEPPIEQLESPPATPDAPSTDPPTEPETPDPEAGVMPPDDTTSDEPVEMPAEVAKPDETETEEPAPSEDEDEAAETVTEGSEDMEAPPGFIPSPAKADDLSNTGSLQATLRAFGSMMDDPEPKVTMPLGDDAAAETTDAEAAPAEPALSRPAPRKVDVAARLKDRLQQIEFNNAPLHGFLQFLSDYSTISITLDPDVLPWLRLTPQSEVSIRQTNATVAEVLTKALQPIGLSHTIVDDQILVGRIPRPGQAPREITLKVGDLGSNPTELERLVNLVEELVEPSAWKAGGGPGTLEIRDKSLVVQQQDRVLFRVVDVCERLRVARGLPLQSSFDPRLFRLATRYERATPQLKQPVSLNFFRPALLIHILQRLSQETDTHLLVDWHAVARVGWNPDATVTMTVADQPLEAALHMLLDPMELTLRAVDDNVLQITTPERIRSTLELEFYPLADLIDAGTSPADLINKITLELGENSFRELGGSNVLRYDERSRHLLAVLPQTQHRRLTQQLAAWRSASP
jgi:hypothetical protein